MHDDIKKRFEGLKIDLSERQIEQFLKFFDLLVAYNEKFNLTAITGVSEVIDKHFVDSLLINKVYDISKVSKMIDIGTGAGFPGIPLKIVYPHLYVVLVDSLNKRVNFLNTVIGELGLEKIVAIHGRAEDFARNEEYREGFNLCVSRAVANLSTLSEYCLPYVSVGGSFVAYKAGKTEEEIQSSKNAIEILGGKIEKVEDTYIPDTDIYRTFVIIEKETSTNEKYPRKAGKALKKPL